MENNDDATNMDNLPGVEQFDRYYEAKNTLVNSLKRAISVMIECGQFEALQGKQVNELATLQLSRDLRWVSSHQWRKYTDNSGLYAQINHPSRGPVQVRVPMGLIGIPSEEIYKKVGQVALTSLTAKRSVIVEKKTKSCEAYDNKINEIDEKIAILQKNMGLVLQEGHPGGSGLAMEYTDFDKGLLPGKPR